MGLFGTKEAKEQRRSGVAAKVPRHSSGWTQLLKELKQQEGLRILDFGATSSTNINFVTSLGHSIYTVGLIDEATDPKWTVQSQLFEQPAFDTESFLKENLEFGDRRFDVVLFWDTAAYLPSHLVGPVVERICSVMAPGGRLLGFFPVKAEGEFSRFHLREDDQVDMQKAGSQPLQTILTTRQIENLFASFTAYKFFLAKDNLREVLVTR